MLPGVLFCVAALDASEAARPAKAPQTLTGCVDQQKGHYVLLDEQMKTITQLRAVSSDQEVFAKHLGHIVQVKGTQSASGNTTFKVISIEELAGKCGPAK
jgi:hypothetical protein